MLWGLLAVSIPIIIHLFNFRKTKKIYFSNVALLKSVEVQTSAMRRLKNWLVLAIRILAIMAIVFAFAQPYVPSDEPNGGLSQQGASAIYIDNSYSMENEGSNQRAIDMAIGQLNEVVGLLKSKGNLQLLTNDFASDDMSLLTPDKLRDRLTTLELTPTYRTIEEVFHRQQKALQEYSREGNNYFIISDFQKSTAGNLHAIQPDSTSKLWIVPAQFPIQRNLYIDSVWLDNPFVKELHNNKLYAKVRNTGQEAVEQQSIRLYLEDMQVSSASASVAAESSTIVSFNFSLKNKGVHTGKIMFEDFPITFDNDYYFILKSSPAIRVKHLYAEQPIENNVRQIYSNDSLFAYSQASVQNLDYGTLANADLIVLEGVPSPTAVLVENLTSFIQNGGTLLVIPPRNPDAIASYTHWLQSLGIRLAKASVDVSSIMLQSPDVRIPFFAGVYENSTSNEALIDMPSVKRLWNWDKVGSTLLMTKDDKPYLSSISRGRGQLMVVASPIQSDFTNLGQHALYVPIMYKIASSSVGATPLAYSFSDRYVEIPISKESSISKEQVVKLVAGETEIIPAQRNVGEKLLIEIPAKEQLSAGSQLKPGYYQVMNGTSELVKIAINFSKEESDMRYYTPEELRQIWANTPAVEVLNSINDVQFNTIFEDTFLGKSLWKYFIVLAICLLIAEMVLLRMKQ